MQRISPKPSGGNPYSCILVLVEAPGFTLLAQYQMITIERFDLQSDIVERLETEVILHDGSVRSRFPDGVALYEQTVALVLEIAEDLSLGKVRERDVTKQGHAARETQVVRV